MTTRLARERTFFLLFNKGRDVGAGNPDNPDGYKTAYLWEQVWEREAWLDILSRFLHMEVKEEKKNGKKTTKETMIFSRYHQWDSVRKMEADARQAGAGKNYLIQHSAGSGKSNSIGWLAHRLASLHDAKDEKVFHSAVVITDRLVLDKQLQDTIYQFEHKQGVVEKIEQDSNQLATALKEGVPIVITTLQKFPFVTEKVGELPARNYAVIVDEAHSSQSGESAAELKGVLAGQAIREQAQQEAEEHGLPDYEEEVLRTMAKRGRQPNLSFFGFTQVQDPGGFRREGTGRQAATVSPLQHAPGDRRRLHPRRAGALRDVQDLLQAHQVHRGRPEGREAQSGAGAGAFHEPAPLQHLAEDGGDGRALPHVHKTQDRGPGEGDGGNAVPVARATSRSSTSTSGGRGTRTCGRLWRSRVKYRTRISRTCATPKWG